VVHRGLAGGDHGNGISARQLWLQLGLGSYESAWLLLAKLRRAMVDPDRAPLAGLVEVDEASIPVRTRDDPITPKPGRAHDGKPLVAGAVEIVGNGPGRARRTVIEDDSAESLGRFVAGHVEPGSTVVSDGWSGYAELTEVEHDPKVVGPMAAHALLPWSHRVFANAKPWALGVHHGLRAPHLQRHLDGFVFRFNRRRTPPAAFTPRLGLAATHDHASYHMLIGRAQRDKPHIHFQRVASTGHLD
jgi:hypothetical protein